MSDVTRALRLRCPWCGEGKIFYSFLKMHHTCSNCHLKFNRGEYDYFIGAYTVNLIVAELIVASAMVLGIFLSWPDVPWNALLYGLMPLAALTPLITFRWATAIWLMLDLRFRPPERKDFD